MPYKVYFSFIFFTVTFDSKVLMYCYLQKRSWKMRHFLENPV